jgi:alkylated DNA repair dioxygenase AlkB
MTGQGEIFDVGVTGPGLDLTLHRDAVSRSVADAALTGLRADVPWQHDEISMFGRRIPLPRLTAWFGDAGLEYTYSGIRMQPRTWTPALQHLREIAENLADVTFNTVLLNLYRDGADGVAWHADDEAELGPEPVIASLSLGASRRFQLRRRDDALLKREMELHHGDMIVMRGSTQSLWLHQIPKTSKPVGERINLTFRTIIG